MRTKKILSILLVMIMSIGVFGITGVFAEDFATDVSLSKAGNPGWNGVVKLDEDLQQLVLQADNEGGVDSAVVVWEAFVGTGDKKPADSDSFWTLYNSRAATIEWKAYRVTPDTLYATSDEIKVYPAKTDSLGLTGTYLKVNNYTDKTDVLLVITQVAGKERYTWVRVELTVTVAGDATYPNPVTGTVWVQLRDPGPLAKKLLEANKELAKTDRYTSVFLDNLRLQTRNAEKEVNRKITQEELDKWLANINLALDAKLPNGASVGKKYKLTGWEFLDNIFPDSVLKWIWAAIDVIIPMFDLVGQIGKFIGYLIPFFTLIGSLLGL
ncbi:MAG: hypothetical protein FWC27_12070 [Firmicutes bacterium]|nr:hypothetical protein [Bacillota bacterium]